MGDFLEAGVGEGGAGGGEVVPVGFLAVGFAAGVFFPCAGEDEVDGGVGGGGEAEGDGGPVPPADGELDVGDACAEVGVFFPCGAGGGAGIDLGDGQGGGAFGDAEPEPGLGGHADGFGEGGEGEEDEEEEAHGVEAEMLKS